MAEWLEHWTCNRESLGSSPTLTVSWVCFWPSHIQLLSQACKFLTGLLLASWESNFLFLCQKFFVSVLNCGPHFRLCSYQKIICVIY